MVLKLLLALVATLTLGVIGAIALGGLQWRDTVKARDAALTASIDATGRKECGSVPQVVLRYLAQSIPLDAPDIGVARLTQSGTFQMGEGPEGWRPFDATEVMSGLTPGFYWDAVIKMAPGIHVRVRDSYVAGSAEMVAKILNVVSVMKAADDPELRQGALSRYLAEAAWIPTRLRIGPGLTWRSIDAQSAEATLVDGQTSVSLRFTFNPAGDLVEVYGLRQREVEGEYVETPWIGRFGEHRDVGGYRIPLTGEVAWIVEGEEKPYWRGRIVEAEFTPLGP